MTLVFIGAVSTATLGMRSVQCNEGSQAAAGVEDVSAGVLFALDPSPGELEELDQEEGDLSSHAKCEAWSHISRTNRPASFFGNLPFLPERPPRLIAVA
jgi:hypothetical protein